MSSTESIKQPFEFRPDAVENWLACLPLNNPAECCRVLYPALQSLNLGNTEDAIFFRILETFRPVLFVTAYRLTPVFLRKTFPLDERSRKLARLAAQFYGELGKGYLQLVAQDGFDTDFDDEVRALIIHRGLQALDLYSLRLAQMFEPPSSSLWERVYLLYRQAERFGVLDWTDRDSDLPLTDRCSIGELFARIVAFRLTVPNQLPQDDIQRVYDFLREYAVHTAVRNSPVFESGSAQFGFDLHSRRMPWPQRRADSSVGVDARYFYVESLIKTLAVLSQPTIPVDTRLDEDLSVYLQVRLGGMPPFTVEQKTRAAHLIIGLEDLEASLAALEFRDSEGSRWANATELEIIPLDGHSSPPWVSASKSAGTFLPQSARASGGDEMPAEAWRPPGGQYHCRVYRADAPGYYLVEPIGASLRPGNLVGINTDNKLIQVGLISGGRHDGAPSLYAFELLASELYTVQAFFDAAPDRSHRALLGRKFTGGDGVFALLTAPVKLQGGDAVTLARNGSRERYRIVKLLEMTREFSEFEVIRDGDSVKV